VTLIALCSGKGAPGVSTLACVVGAVWPSERRIVVAECDPSGNDLAARFGLSPRVGMTSLVLAHRHAEYSEATFDAQMQMLPGGLEVLVGPVSADAASSLDRELAVAGPGIFREGVDVMVDCGRLLCDAPGQQEVLKGADHVVVVTCPDAAGLAHALWTLEVVQKLTINGGCSFVVVGPSPFQAREMEHALRARLLGTIPLDEKSAAMACGAPGKPRSFAQSNLVASARRLVEQILDPPDSVDDFGGGAPRTTGGRIRHLSDNGVPAVHGFDLAAPREHGAHSR
jgi:MinD-like ATPase involved in chromosome partitioning or flagellar assembly